MPVIHASYRSRATRNVWLGFEAGIPIEMRLVLQAYRLADPLAADAPMNTLSPAFLAMSPAGAIPVLQDGDLILSESLAINLYLARKYGGPLGPQGATEDAAMTQWALFGASSVEPDAVAVMYVHSDKRADTAEGQSELARYRDRLQRPLQVLEAHLAAQGQTAGQTAGQMAGQTAGQMVGGRFTVADINMAEIIRYAATEPALIAPFPALAAWYAACQARPAFRKMWALRLAEPL